MTQRRFPRNLLLSVSLLACAGARVAMPDAWLAHLDDGHRPYACYAGEGLRTYVPRDSSRSTQMMPARWLVLDSTRVDDTLDSPRYAHLVGEYGLYRSWLAHWTSRPPPRGSRGDSVFINLRLFPSHMHHLWETPKGGLRGEHVLRHDVVLNGELAVSSHDVVLDPVPCAEVPVAHEH